PLANFLPSGLFELQEKLGPILWQFPPSMPFDPRRLERFLSLLPGDTHAAARQAALHHQRMPGSAALDPGLDARPRSACCAAARLAARHDQRMAGRAALDPGLVARQRAA